MKRSFEYTYSSDEDDNDLLNQAMDDFERTQQVGGAAAAPLLEYTWSSDEDDDHLLNKAMDDFERTRTQQVGGGARKPLFQFTLTSIGPRRRWKNVVERAQFRAELHQLRNPWLVMILGQSSPTLCIQQYKQKSYERTDIPMIG